MISIAFYKIHWGRRTPVTSYSSARPQTLTTTTKVLQRHTGVLAKTEIENTENTEEQKGTTLKIPTVVYSHRSCPLAVVLVAS